MQNKEFLGRGWKFPLSVDPRTGKIAMVSLEDDIQESVAIIIKTNVGERVMRPDFGTHAADHIFESNTEGFEQRVKTELEEALIYLEPRIRDVAVSVEEDASREGVALVNVGYTVRSTNNYFNMVYPFYLMEGINA